MNDQPGAGDFVYLPEGAKDIRGSGFEESADETDVFGGDGFDTSQSRLAGGEADEAIARDVEGADVFGGECAVGELESGVFWLAVVVFAVASEVEGSVVSLQSFGSFSGGDGVSKVAGIANEIADEVGFNAGVGHGRLLGGGIVEVDQRGNRGLGGWKSKADLSAGELPKSIG